ncbi:MAG: ABC transporter ATP-binding protein [Tepidisphaeraceae bacterium]
MPQLVTIDSLDFAYGQQLVLKHITLPVERSTVLGIIGPNAGGKTTLIRLMLGLITPTRGSIRIDGLTPAAALRKGDVIGYLPQSFNMPTDFPISIRQLVRLGLCGKTGPFRPYSPGDLQFVDWLIERMGLADMARRPIGSVSGGQRQRAFIARALAPRPKLLLLDEPTTGIDRSGQQQFIEFMLALKRELDLTVVLVSHDLRAVCTISDRIACLNVTLHYHDVPEHLPAELMYRMFSCDLEAAGLRNRPPLMKIDLPHFGPPAPRE